MTEHTFHGVDLRKWVKQKVLLGSERDKRVDSVQPVEHLEER